MAANKKKIRLGSHDDIEGLARLPDESNSPVMRLDPDGVVIYANKYSRTLHDLLDPETMQIEASITQTALECYKANEETRIDYVTGDVIFELAIIPVHEFEYVNIYGRDATQIREAQKQAIDLTKFPNENPNPVMRALANGNLLFCNHASESIPGVVEQGPPIRLSTMLANTASESMRTREITSVKLESGVETYLFTYTPVEGEDYVNIYGRNISSEIDAQNALVAANEQLERRVAERTASVRLLQNIVLAANSADSFEAALQTAVHEICIYANWPVGHAYVVEHKDGQSHLVPSGIWHIETASQLSDLGAATENLRFGDVSGLPGRVLAESREVWIENLETYDDFRRGEFADQAGLRAGMAFPITINQQVIGVIEFFAQDVTPANIEIIKTLEHVGAQLGSVAERKAAEAEVKKSREEAELAHLRMTDALEVIGQGFVLFDKDDNIALFNTKYAERIRGILGRDPVVGDSFESIMRASAEVNYIPDSMENKEQWVQRILRDRKETKQRDSISKQNDGTWFRAEGYETSDGGTVSIFTDVTELKEKEEELAEMARQSELAHVRLHDGIQALGQGFALFDQDERYVMFNDKYADMIDVLARRPVVGESFAEVLKDTKRNDFGDLTREEWMKNVLDERKSDKARNSTNRLPDGSWYKAEGFRTRDGGNVSVFTDITELKEHEKELDALVKELGVARDAAVDANSAKSQFLANMSHELRTPLNAIIGYAELLADDAEDDENEEYIPDLQKIQNAGKHLLGLINDILDLSKIEVGKIELYVEEISVSEMMEDVSNTIKPLVDKNNNTLEIEMGEGVDTIHSDLTKLRQNLFNLLSNAAKFTENGALSVKTRIEPSPSGDLIVFDVTDEGIGMTPEQLDRIFDPFTQADSSTSKKFGGTGLGLTITREFSRMLGGDILAVSEAGVGTTFTMKVAVDGTALVNKQGEDEPRAGNTSDVSEDSPLVLIIDDDPNVRELLHRNLNVAGYRTEMAVNGKEGLKKAKELLPDAITLDVIMPTADGWSVLSQLKSTKATANIPVVMVTIAEDRSLGFSLGASEYLSKPVDRKKLVRVLDKFLQHREGESVLLIEDDEPTRTVMRLYLEKEGASVVEATNGREGIEALEQATPSMILLDLMMPEMDGFGFIEEYRKRPEWHTIPVVVVTAKSLTEDEKRKLDGWVDALYSKLESSIDDVLKDIQSKLQS